MNLDSNLIQIQGALLKANNSNSFKNLTSRGGYEKEIQNTVDILSNILTNKGYVEDNKPVLKYDEILRNINLFLILNSDLKNIDKLVDNDEIGHLIWITPTITQCLLIHLVYGLHIEDYYCEAIYYVPPVLSLDLLNVATQNIKYFSPKCSIILAGKLIKSAYGMTCMMKKNPPKEETLQNLLTRINGSIYELLKFYGDSPNKTKISSWKKSELYFYSGEVLLNMFQLLISCFKLFFGESCDNKDNYYIYTLIKFEENETPQIDGNSLNNLIQNYLIKFNEMLIQITKENIQAVNVDIYCSWCEYDINDKTFQRVIGESAYELQNILKTYTNLDDELISMLSSISCRPLELLDIINEADKEMIIQKSNEINENQKYWLSTLSKKDYLFLDKNCIECLCCNVDLLSQNEIEELFKSSLKNIYSNIKFEYLDDIKKLSFICLNKLNNDDQKCIVLQEFSNYILNDNLEMTDYNEQITIIFNKITYENIEIISHLLCLFLQNPFKLYTKIFEECIQHNQTFTLLSAIEYFKDFYDLKYNSYNENCITSTIGSLVFEVLMNIKIENIKIQVERDNFPLFIGEICSKNIIDTELLLTKYIVPSLDIFLDNYDWKDLLMCILCEQKLFSVKNLMHYYSPALVMCAQILEKARWDLSTYSSIAVELIQETLQLKEIILQKFIEVKKPTDSEWLWIKSKINSMTPLTLIHYNKLFPSNNFSLLNDSLGEKERFICLTFLLPRTLLYEWKNIYATLLNIYNANEIFKLFCDILQIILIQVKEFKTNSMIGCLENCCGNLSILLQNAQIKNPNECLEILRNIIFLVNSLPESIFQNIFDILISSIISLIKAYKNNFPENSLKLDNVVDIIDILDDVAATNKLMDILQV